ncbi:hypothetical protein TNCV_3645601 [Trichonephila clavipes]|nr:hypothetical protein TNCV_3645601 [Trichonephila clavipes]
MSSRLVRLKTRRVEGAAALKRSPVAVVRLSDETPLKCKCLRIHPVPSERLVVNRPVLKSVSHIVRRGSLEGVISVRGGAARDLELKVNEDDIEKLIMGHEDELTIEELEKF